MFDIGKKRGGKRSFFGRKVIFGRWFKRIFYFRWIGWFLIIFIFRGNDEVI